MTKPRLALLPLMCFLLAGAASFAVYARGREVFWLTVGVVYGCCGLAISIRVRRR